MTAILLTPAMTARRAVPRQQAQHRRGESDQRAGQKYKTDSGRKVLLPEGQDHEQPR